MDSDVLVEIQGHRHDSCRRSVAVDGSNARNVPRAEIDRAGAFRDVELSGSVTCSKPRWRAVAAGRQGAAVRDGALASMNVTAPRTDSLGPRARWHVHC
jgi:hypothetical protein